MSANFSNVPVVDVHIDNVESLKPGLELAINNADFIAIDCELSGLGDRKKLNAYSLDDRFANLGCIAQTRSIIAIGLSCFKLKNDEPGETHEDKKPSWHYRVQTFNIMVLCNEDYIVEPSALKFLIEHGFDFQKQYSSGLGYYRGNDREDSSGKCYLRDLFSTIIRSKKSIVVHNGFIDLVFLYQNLYAHLPQSVNSFLGDLSQMFSSGVYDTKFLTDFVSRSPASYLEFIFRKEQRGNCEKARLNRPHVKISFPNYCKSPQLATFVDFRNCELPSEDAAVDDAVCETFRHHGYCTDKKACGLSHDIDHVIAKNEGRKRKSSQANGENGAGDAKKAKTATNESSGGSGAHRAGFDAFMTGFAFATFLVHYTKLPQSPEDFKAETIGASSFVNRLYLACKDFPLIVQKSTFAKMSAAHCSKYEKIFSA